MKFAVSVFLSASVYVLDASLYPTGTTAHLKCDQAEFDAAGAAASGSPADKAGCTSTCLTDHLDTNAATDAATGHVIGLAADKYAGCSFPAEYAIMEKASVPCMFSSTKGAGFFTAIDSNVTVTRDRIVSAIFSPRVTTAGTTAWQIYPAVSSVDSCATGGAYEGWILGNVGTSATASGDTSSYKVDLTAFYKYSDADKVHGKMYIFAVPGSDTTVWEKSVSNTVATVSTGPVQVGVSAACGALANCTSCMESCHWCQLTVGDAMSGLCGVTQGQCAAQPTPFGSFAFDHCDATATTTKTNTGTTTTTAAGASSTMMLSVAGAVVLSAALTL